MRRIPICVSFMASFVATLCITVNLGVQALTAEAGREEAGDTPNVANVKPSVRNTNLLREEPRVSNRPEAASQVVRGSAKERVESASREELGAFYTSVRGFAGILDEDPHDRIADIQLLPPDQAERLASRFVPHLFWDLGEPFFNVPVEWIDRYMPAFFPLQPHSEVEWVVPEYNVLDSNGNILYSGRNNLLALSLGAVGADHLGWGPNAFILYPDLPPGHVSTRLPIDGNSIPFSVDQHIGDCFRENFGLCSWSPCRRWHYIGNLHADASTPLYYYAFFNSDGNIEMNYRGFAYRDDLAYPRCGFLGVGGSSTNDDVGGHWGDWEPNITVVLSPSELPLYTYYSAHRTNQIEDRLIYPLDSMYQPRYLLWEDVRKDRDGHPAVLVSSSKHATYYTSWAFRVPNLSPLSSPTPLDPNAPMRPQFLNQLREDKPLGLGYSEDRVGESFVHFPFVGDIYLGEHWVPTTLVNLSSQLWNKFEGKWGESPDSPTLPRPTDHPIREFVKHYRYTNSLPQLTDGISVVDFYSADGPRYAADLNIGHGGTFFHNVYHSILTPLGFATTQSLYDDIRFRWWNDVSLEGLTALWDTTTCTLHVAVDLRNNETFSVLSYGLRCFLGNSIVASVTRELGQQEFAPGTLRHEIIDVSSELLSPGGGLAAVEVFGRVTLPADAETGHTRSFDVPLARSETLLSAPTSVAGGPYDVECQGTVTVVALDGSASSDPVGNKLFYEWTTDCPDAAFDDPTSVRPSLRLNTSCACTVQCLAKLSVRSTLGCATDTTTVVIRDTQAPATTCPDSTIVWSHGAGPLPVEDPQLTSFLESVRVVDACDKMPMLVNDAPPLFPLGRTTVSFKGSDRAGNTSHCTQTVTVAEMLALVEAEDDSAGAQIVHLDPALGEVHAGLSLGDRFEDATGMAVVPGPSGYQLFIVTDDTLFVLAPGSNALKLVGPLGRHRVKAIMAAPRTGVLYGLVARDESNDLIRIDPVNAQVTRVARKVLPGRSIRSAAFHPDGTLYILVGDATVFQIVVPTGHVLRKWQLSSRSRPDEFDELVWSPDGSRLFAIADRGRRKSLAEVNLRERRATYIGRGFRDIENVSGLAVHLGLALSTGNAAAAALPKTTKAQASPLVLHQNSPNPFNPSTRIDFDLPSRGDVALSIFDMKGRLVSSLVSSMLDPGRHSVVWDGRTTDRMPVASGVYVVRLDANAVVVTRKIVLAR